MAPTNKHSGHRGGSHSAPRRGRTYRNANTNAGINGSSSTTRNGNLARESRQRRLRSDRARPPTTASTGPSLASRIAYGDGRGRGRPAIATSRPRTPRGQLQDHFTYASDGGGGGGGHAALHAQMERRVQGEIDGTGLDDIEPGTDDIDHFNFFKDSPANTNNTFRQVSALLCGSQLTQATSFQEPLSPVIEVDEDGELLFPPSGPVLAASYESRPISLINRTPDRPTNRPADHASSDDPVTPKRPINTYRGKDAIKKIVQNKKLQAILGDKPIPGERKKHRDERVELRMGVSRVMK
ncbi:hypothetical protein BKA63DRAFT_152029 [Paraphoma chrysanthemicola]|nr:hypothetical protein BKA63DRAFT_152029 [Paraphoma chrysanthemicola]